MSLKLLYETLKDLNWFPIASLENIYRLLGDVSLKNLSLWTAQSEL